jgi:hypothetical protein
VAGRDELEIVLLIADFESIGPDDRLGQEFARDPRRLSQRIPGYFRPAEEPDEGDDAQPEDDSPGEEREIEGRFPSSHLFRDWPHYKIVGAWIQAIPRA